MGEEDSQRFFVAGTGGVCNPVCVLEFLDDSLGRFAVIAGNFIQGPEIQVVETLLHGEHRIPFAVLVVGFVVRAVFKLQGKPLYFNAVLVGNALLVLA